MKLIVWEFMKENKQCFMPADRLNTVEEYYFSRKLKEVATMRASGLDVISLAIGSPDLNPSDKTIETLCQTVQQDNMHGYQPTVGILELKQAMADWYKKLYNVTLDPQKEIQPLIGSKEGILHITMAFVNPGDGVLVPNPGYPTYTSINRLLGADLHFYDLTETQNWQPNLEALKDLDLGKVKTMWVNYPHMPTGAKAEVKTFERLVAFAQEHQIVIINDNPYSLILNDKPLSILQIDGAKDCCIELNSMSKSHNMPGWRMGMLLSNETFVQWVLKVKSNVDSGVFKPLQLAAAEALKNSEQWHKEYNIAIYQRRRKLAEQIMQLLQCDYDPQQVGMFLWGRIPAHYSSCEELTEELLQRCHIFITPGFIFGSNGERYIRISLCASEERMKEAIDRIKTWKK